ncbi:hypothetical protein HRbin32_01687 [bacterium HR32]|nr:hypothetical protein HRbin32_01687 [bacterium HR32]
MAKRAPKFRPVGPKEWGGFYKRIPGKDTAYHVRSGTVFCLWERRRYWRLWCAMVGSAAADELVRAVREGKRFFGYSGGGSFLINEYGQVLVPSPAGDGRQALVGEWMGSLEFVDPLNNEVFDMADDGGLELGDPWLRPYVGVPHHLSRRDELYFWSDSLDLKVPPPGQDPRLIECLRSLRPHGPVRFITLPGGFALTKVPRRVGGRTVWQPVYVGRLDLDSWFPKEE